MGNAELEDQFLFFQWDGDATEFYADTMWSKELQNWTTANSPTLPPIPTTSIWPILQTGRRRTLGPPLPSVHPVSSLGLEMISPLSCLMTSYTSLIDKRWLNSFATLVIERYGVYSFTLNLDGLCDCLANGARQAQASQIGSFHSLSLRLPALEVASSH